MLFQLLVFHALVLFKVIFTRMYFTKFSLEISQELLQITLNFSLIFLIWNPIVKIKFMVSIMHRQIDFNKSVNFNLPYLHMESESGLIFKNISSLVNLNSQTKLFKKNYTLIILWVSNLHFSQIEWYGKRNQTLE